MRKQPTANTPPELLPRKFIVREYVSGVGFIREARPEEKGNHYVLLLTEIEAFQMEVYLKRKQSAEYFMSKLRELSESRKEKRKP